MLSVGILYLILILIIIDRQAWSINFQHFANLAFCVKLITIGSILFICKIRRAMINMNANKLKKDNYEYFKNKEGKFYNQFDKGIWSNVRDYFKTNSFFINGKDFLAKSNHKYNYHLLPKTDSFDL